MKAYVRDHDAAMEAYDRYELAQKAGRHGEASDALLQALRLEAAAAKGVPAGLEPTRSVLFRSAASIALDAGRTAHARRLIAEGLRGDPPAEIKEELLELLLEPSFVQDELRNADGLLSPGTVLQRLVLRGAALSMATITKIHDAWIEYFEPSLEQALGAVKSDPPRLEAVQAAVGSFALELKISGELNRDGQRIALDILQELGGDLSQLGIDTTSPAQAKRALPRLLRLVSLLTMLKQEHAQLDVQMRVVGEERAVEIFITPPPTPLLLRLQRAVAGHVDSEDVPQANVLHRVLELVRHVFEHATLPSPEQLGVVGRQVSYYRRAAEILGYLHADRSGLPTPAAAYIARASPEARLRHALQRFEASAVGNAWITWAECSRLCEVEPSSATDFLAEVSIGLSPATVERRAKTLQAWYDALAPVFDETDE